MPVRQNDVIDRLKAGETIIRVLPKGDTESEKPYQYLSGGGASNGSHLRQASAQPLSRQPRPVPGCGAAGTEVA